MTIPMYTENVQGFDSDTRPQTNVIPVYNVRAYGARGDGKTDDTNSFQAACNACIAEGRIAGIVYVPYSIPAGYLCGVVSIPSGVTLMCAPGVKIVAPATVAASWFSLAATAHVDTAVIGGIFDATAITSTNCNAVIDFGLNPTSLRDVHISYVRILNAPVHGIYIKDPAFTNYQKRIDHCAINNAGVQATGYGIYGDFIGNLDIEHNWVNTSAVDAIELGHSGPAHLGGLNANMRCTNNTVVGGGIQFPFSDYAQIIDNTIIGGTQGIQNDGNGTTGVCIEGNTLLGIAPAASYGAISMNGDHFTCTGNTILMASTNAQWAIGGNGNGALYTDSYVGQNMIVLNNASQTGIQVDSASGTTSRNQIVDNHIQGTAAIGIAVGANKVMVARNYVSVSAAALWIIGAATLGYTMDAVDLIDNDFTQSGSVLTAFTTMPTGSVWRNNKGLNPLGTITPSVPASGTAVPASGANAELYSAVAVPYTVDRTYYVTAAAGGTTTIAIGGGPSVVIPAAAMGTVRIPAGKTVTPTYGVGNAPTWVVEGE